MSDNVIVLIAIIAIVLVFGVGLGVSEYYNHVENLAKIERGCDD